MWKNTHISFAIAVLLSTPGFASSIPGEDLLGLSEEEQLALALSLSQEPINSPAPAENSAFSDFEALQHMSEEDQVAFFQAMSLENSTPQAPEAPIHPHTDEAFRLAIEESLKPIKINREEITQIENQMQQNQQQIDELAAKIAENERAMRDHYSYQNIEHTYVRTNNALRARQDGLVVQNMVLQEKLDQLKG
ncbi:MAG: hypothetical protein KBB83_03765 [Alphaproteobacteria bacterium]|nr:hypothetical protein [Alphaproteobacteria bacterium]